MNDMTFDEDKQLAEVTQKAKPKAKSTRTRATAKEATQKARRRRNNVDGSMRGKLSIDTSKLDPNYQYRWIENRPGRINEATKQDDYDIVPHDDVHDSISGSDVRRPSGEHDMILVRKPIEFYNEDQKAKSKSMDELEDQIKQGGEAASKLGADHYTPDGGIVFSD